MTQWYNLTSVSGADIVTFVSDINTNFSNNLLGISIIIVLFAVSFISFNYYFSQRSTILNLSTSLFFTGVLSMLFYTLGWVVMLVPIINWIFFAIALTLLIFKG